MNTSAVPRLKPGFKLRFDQTREQWVILGPERLFQPDEHAVAVLQRMDGKRTISDIAADLARDYAAPAEVIEADVRAMLTDLAARGAVSL